MTRINLYQFGVYEPESGYGVNEFLYQHTNLLKDAMNIHFINFTLDDPQAYECTTKADVRIHNFGKLKYRGLSFPARFIEWLDEISSSEINIFHLHSVFRISNFRLSHILTKKEIPYIFTPHDSYSQESLKKKLLLKLLFLKTCEKYILDHAKIVHAITHFGVKDISRFTKNAVTMVTNFVQDANPNTEAPPPAKDHICFIGRFDIYQKGIDLQLEAFRMFQSKSQTKVPFMLIGRCSTREKTNVANLCKHLNINMDEQIKLTGRISDQEKFQHLRDAYVYLQLSRFEGFGLSIVEALSFYKPVIISNQVPIKKHIEAYQAGFVVNNSQEAATALEKVYSLSPEEYQQMAQNARRCYEEQFHPRIIKPQLLHMYESVVPELI